MRSYRWAMVIILATLGVAILLFEVSVDTSPVRTEESKKRYYYDDGLGLVVVGSKTQGGGQERVYKGLQQWREDYPGRWNRQLWMTTSSYWDGAIIVYAVDDSVLVSERGIK